MASHRCPICDKEFRPEESRALPFCSDRCRLVDLGRWLDERYGLETAPAEEEEEPPSDPDQPPAQ
jgi:endogenous inhibitor of DNA gyrase (YacG/DUF329 family)